MDLRESPGRTATRHPWEIARADFFCRVVGGGQAGAVTVLDVGSGDGYFAEQLLDRLPSGSRVVCCDSEYSAEWLAAGERRDGLSFVRELPDDRFDWVVLLDVLEHVRDDRALLTEIVTRNLNDRGRALVSVPAWAALYTRHDEMLGHFRRYTGAELKRVLKAAGLTPLLGGGLFASLLGPRALGKLAELARGHRSKPPDGALDAHVVTEAGSWTGGPLLTRAVAAALKIDASLCWALASRSMGVPGLSVWAMGQKP